MRPSTIEKQKKIIEIATVLFLEQGYRDTSLDQIVQHCGGSKQTLYRYFSSKEGLFKAVLAHNLESLEGVFSFPEHPDHPVDACLVHFGLGYVKRLCSNPVLGLFRIVSADFHQDADITDFFLANGPENQHHHLASYLKSEGVTQQLTIPSANQACTHLLAMLKQNFFYLALLGKSLPDDEQLTLQIRQAVDAFIRIYHPTHIGR